MILVDTTVWVDSRKGTKMPHVDRLDAEMGRQWLGLTDLILCKALQGVRGERRFGGGRRGIGTSSSIHAEGHGSPEEQDNTSPLCPESLGRPLQAPSRWVDEPDPVSVRVPDDDEMVAPNVCDAGQGHGWEKLVLDLSTEGRETQALRGLREIEESCPPPPESRHAAEPRGIDAYSVVAGHHFETARSAIPDPALPESRRMPLDVRIFCGHIHRRLLAAFSSTACPVAEETIGRRFISHGTASPATVA